jgi:hypothetical protein
VSGGAIIRPSSPVLDAFHNQRRPHPSLDGDTPDEVLLRHSNNGDGRMTDRTTGTTSVTITLTADEAVVLFELLQRYSDTDKLTIEDQAEERALWNLCCVLENDLVVPFGVSYPEALQAARNRLRDEE